MRALSLILLGNFGLMLIVASLIEASRASQAGTEFEFTRVATYMLGVALGSLIVFGVAFVAGWLGRRTSPEL